MATIAAAALVLGLAAPVRAAAPLRVLIVGDSITQGAPGDWTWRYFLWQNLRADGVAVDFVGPRNWVKDHSRAYASSGFDEDHAAQWGASVFDYAGVVAPIGDLVSAYQPDILIEDLGYNDWRRSTLDAFVTNMTQFVRDAQAAKPDLDIVMGRIGHDLATRPALAGWNDAITGLAQTLGTDTSRVVVNGDYTITPAHTYDGTHPRPSGEVKIAQAMEQGLVGLGVATVPRLATPAPYSQVARPVVTVSDRKVASLRWTPGWSTEAVLSYRRVGATAWQRVTTTASTAQLVLPDRRRVQHYDFVLRLVRHGEQSSRLSTAVRVRVGKTRTPRPVRTTRPPRPAQPTRAR